MKKQFIVVVCMIIALVSIVLLTAYNPIPTDHDGISSDDSMFVICESTSASKSFYVVYHKDTKVMYAVSASGNNYGNFTLLVNPDGTPMLWED